MKVFVAGATGAVGRQLVPGLVAAGHQVTATTRSQAKAGGLRAAGAEPAVLDGLDAAAVSAAVAAAAPEVIIHEMTALPRAIDLRHFDRTFAVTNELRTRGLDHLLAAAAATGTRRVIAQSYAGWPTAGTNGAITTESDPFDENQPAAQRKTFAAIRYLEQALADAPLEGVALRYGGLYGPGASEAIVAMIRRRRVPVIGSGAGVWSFLHVADAASATIAALDSGSPGAYNVTDDDPAPVSEWLPAVAAAIGAPSPWRIPEWLGRLAGGEVAVSMMTRIHGASNAKAKRELGWQPAWPSWRDGFAKGLTD
jgi:nucleoside-diphosphate-sugar epimerase